MPRDLAPASIVEKNRLSTDNPFLLLVEVEVPTSPPTRLRLAANPTAVTFGGQVYSPADVSISEVREDARGEVNDLTVEVQGVTLEVVGLLETHGGLSGQPVKVMLVNRVELPSGKPTIEDRWEVRAVEADERRVTARLGQWSLYRAQVPGRRLMRTHCPFQFRAAECGYLGALSTCDHTLDGPNGCRAHGADSADHPARFGGAPLLPRLAGESLVP